MRKQITLDIGNYSNIEKKYKTLPRNKDLIKSIKGFILELMETYNKNRHKMSSSQCFHLKINEIKIKILVLSFYNTIHFSFNDNDDYHLILNNMNVKDISKVIKPMYIFLYAYYFDKTFFTEVKKAI